MKEEKGETEPHSQKLEGDRHDTEITPQERRNLLGMISNPASPLNRLPPAEHEELEGKRQDRGLKKTYACWLMWIMIVQLLLLNLTMFFIGFGLLEFTDWLFHSFLVGTFGEILSIVYVIAVHLFPSRRGIDQSATHR